MAQLADSSVADYCCGELDDIDAKKLHSQKISTSSFDSGMCSHGQSRNPSSSSLTSLNHSNIVEPLPSIKDIPTITIDQPDRSKVLIQDNVYEVERIASDDAQTDWQLLGIQARTRKGSNTSTISSEYCTAPNSPILSIKPRSMSLDSVTPLNLPKTYLPATDSSRSSQIVTTHVERKNKSICVTVDLQSRPIEVELRFRPKAIKINPKDQVFDHTSSSPSMLDGFPCDLTVKISNGLPPFQTNPLPTTTKDVSNQETENERIEQIIKRNLVAFSKHTNLEALYPHLMSSSLISTSDYEQLEAIKSTNGRMNYLYILLLPKKGKIAYEIFFKCLKDENTHCGHECLVNLINTEL